MVKLRLKASKAKEMLEDGTANKQPLTEKQKKYFRSVAHGWKPKAKLKAQEGLVVNEQNPNLPFQQEKNIKQELIKTGAPIEYQGTFNQAFSSAMKELGKGKKFIWQGNEYALEYAEDKKEAKPIIKKAQTLNKVQNNTFGGPRIAYQGRQNIPNENINYPRPILRSSVSGFDYSQAIVNKNPQVEKSKLVIKTSNKIKRFDFDPIVDKNRSFAPDMPGNVINKNNGTVTVGVGKLQSSIKRDNVLVKNNINIVPIRTSYETVQSESTNTDTYNFIKERAENINILKSESFQTNNIIDSKTVPEDVKDKYIDFVNNNKTGNKPYAIISKTDLKYYLFDKNHKLIKSLPILIGADIGDKGNPYPLSEEKGQVKLKVKTTPAGEGVYGKAMTDQKSINSFGKYGALPMNYNNLPVNEVYYYDPNKKKYTSRELVATHGVYKPDEIRRMKALITPTITDNRISYGCINTDDMATISKYIQPGSYFAVTQEPGNYKKDYAKSWINTNTARAKLKTK